MAKKSGWVFEPQGSDSSICWATNPSVGLHLHCAGIWFMLLGKMSHWCLGTLWWFSLWSTDQMYSKWYCIIWSGSHTTELRISLNHWTGCSFVSGELSPHALLFTLLPSPPWAFSYLVRIPAAPLRCLLDSALSSPGFVFLPFVAIETDSHGKVQAGGLSGEKKDSEA